MAVLLTTTRSYAEVLYGPTYYTSAVASSTFEYDPTYGIGNVFDNDLDSQWASWGNTLNGYNPQGNQEVWFSFTLDEPYVVDAIRFSPRQPNDAEGDFITGLKVWIGGTSFGVNVQSAEETNDFLSSPLGANPTLDQSVNFSDVYSPETYSLLSPVAGQYFLVQLTTDFFLEVQNIGAREFVVSVVPEPSTYAMALAGLACGGYSILRRRKRA
ncbi:MAG: PEP-CTERM sorting domain-containing protein [Planctomycetota bacterium]